MRLFPLFMLAACEPMAPKGVLEPVPASSSAPVVSTPKGSDPAPASVEGFDFDADEGVDDADQDIPDDPAALLAAAQGLPIPEPSAVPDTPAPSPDPTPAVTPFAPVPAPVVAAPATWDPSTAVPPDWGVRLVSTVPGTQPPRAVLGLSDGSEVVVKPGSFLPDHKLVVMAVGNNAVQVSRVIPEGYQARVETKTLASFFPSAEASPVGN